MIFEKKTGMQIAILGSGSFGTALAAAFAAKNSVVIWGNDPSVAQEINEKHTNTYYFENMNLPPSIKATTSLEEAIDESDIIVFAVPSQATREVAEKCRHLVKKNMILVSVAKGLEEKTGKRMSEILHETLTGIPIAVLSGPSLADELARKVPTTVVAVSDNEEVAKKVQETLVTPYFRIYTSTDMIGVELGGVLKNIIAIAAGINNGLGFGSNSKAALITRGMVEMIRFGKALGAEEETFLGLSGIGDLIETCTSELSRNWNCGYRIGKGQTLEQSLKETKTVCEGVKAAKVVQSIAKEKGVDMPITNAVYQVLFEDKNPLEAVRELMTRDIRSEKMY